MKTDAEYWRRRSRELLDAMEADEAAMIQRLAEAYKSEAAKLERDLRAYYAEYGEDRVIQYRKLLASCSEADRRLLIEKMEEFGRKYPKWAHLLPVRASIYKLDAMEAIQLQIYLQELEIGAIEQDEFDQHLREQALCAANMAAEQMGYGTSFYMLDSAIVEACAGLAWSAGENYSERIWANRQKLASYLSDDFAKAVARGVAYDKIARDMAERFEDVSVRNAKRLVFTEGTFIFNEAQARVHEQRFDVYTVETVRDGKVCGECKGIQNMSKANPIPFSERAPGINFPPLHPWCRCVYQVAVSDWDAWIDGYVVARGGDSGTVAAHMDAILSMESKTPVRAYAMSDALRLPPKEYAIVKSAINSSYEARYKGKSVGMICVEADDGASVYEFDIRDFDDYVIKGKEMIL